MSPELSKSLAVDHLSRGRSAHESSGCLKRGERKQPKVFTAVELLYKYCLSKYVLFISFTYVQMLAVTLLNIQIIVLVITLILISVMTKDSISL